MSTILKFRRGTAASATSNDKTLAQGEPGYETDTGLLKIGDGSTSWNSLGYFGALIWQPLDDELTAIAGLTSAADKGIVFTGSGTADVYTLTAFGRTLAGSADAAAGRSSLAAAGTGVTNTFSTGQIMTSSSGVIGLKINGTNNNSVSALKVIDNANGQDRVMFGVTGQGGTMAIQYATGQAGCQFAGSFGSGALQIWRATAAGNNVGVNFGTGSSTSTTWSLGSWLTDNTDASVSLFQGAFGTNRVQKWHTDRTFFRTAASAPTDADLWNGTVSFYLDESGDKLKVRVKYSDGTLKTGEVALT